ncbi:glycosyltransferase family 1 protein [Xylanibacillus composti]|uniref:Spore coat protein SA n=1 Tax=Xylanibacillus composti TaxID=1572762 RepID=A0A8J4H490_9BACL|nr:glycosyltransferase family 4 protein [Xylanibacillus composti]MDT9723554.1 glycosyltransferase family 1 protein [Xylanibacillus composti]GIQ68408.1 spore coat protein SA [Xylanibacillus composti]
MRILMIAPEQFPLPGDNSVEICMLAIAKRMVKQHSITIVCRRFPQQKARSQIGGVHIVRLAAKSKSYLSSVLRYLKHQRFDLIQVDNRPHYMARVKRLCPGTPVSLFLHSLTFVPNQPKVAASLNKADLIVSNSTSLTQRLGTRFPRQRHKIKTAHLGVDTERFKPADPAKRQAARSAYQLNRCFAILFAGRLIPRKGVHVLIQATRLVQKKVPHAKLMIVGRGKQPYIRSLKAQAKKAGVAAAFIGKVPHSKMHRLYQAADCFVCPSQLHEAFGLVNVEAMSAGVPVIASSIGGIKEIIQHGKNGYLVRNYRSPESFAAYIIKLANKKTTAAYISRMGRDTAVRQFNWQRTADRLSLIYSQRRRG